MSLPLRSLALLPAVAVLLSAGAPAFAASPQTVFEQVAGQVRELEVLDAAGQVLAALSAVTIGEAQVVTQCDLVDGAAGLRLRAVASLLVARVAHADVRRNLCLLDVPGLPGPPAVLATVLPAAGARVLAVGNALGLGVGVSDGVVAAIREIGGERLIQHTAPVAPGSQGGGLFDDGGRLVGVIRYRKLAGQNVNFAAPAAWIAEIAERAAAQGELREWRKKAVALEGEARWAELAALAARRSERVADEPEAWFWFAIASEAQRDWPTAERAYRQALARVPGDVTSGLGLARARINQERFDEALGGARELLASQREDTRVWTMIGWIEIRRGQAPAAAEALAEAMRLAPWNTGAQHLAATLAVNRRDWPTAVRLFRQLTRGEPANALLWIQLAEAQYGAQDYERALAAAEQLLALSPEHADGLLWKGAALSALGRRQEAIEALRAALAGAPASPVLAWLALANTYYALRLFPEAIAAYRQAEKFASHREAAQDSLGIALKDAGQFDAALQLFEAARAKRPEDPFVWRQIGFVNAALGRSELAIAALEQSLKLDAKQAKVWHALLESYHAAGRPEDVRRVHARLLELDRGHAEQAYRDYLLPYESAR
ncbi:MAG: tetratricopeptide repeat protein [Candidatus Accumulibacter phosphatis]|uniref:tetratricopeptide repeat protein n=1 Tax=Candidatus Accumulibacter phosphatis TaxID=327160 RepID=UPI001A37D3C4|nr:tetratricopeptide repeat protein [Candidatus Accumulibacter phosphatis]